MINTIQPPDFRDISTPWDPQPIAWRYTNGARNKDDIRAQVANPDYTHIVREVQVVVRKPSAQFDGTLGLPMSIDETLEGLALVDEQFRQLETLSDIRVADREWFVFADEAGVTRTLARVGIIDGQHPVWRSLTEQQLVPTEENIPQLTHEAGMKAYFRGRSGVPLDDINSLKQYIFGEPRLKTPGDMGGKALYLVDIEPMLWHNIGERRH